MPMRSWIRHLFARPVTRPFRKAPFRARPTLEVLEDRWVPSTTKPLFPVPTPIAQGTTNGSTADPMWTVTSTADDGSVGTLRWAVGKANADGGNETINFDP